MLFRISSLAYFAGPAKKAKPVGSNSTDKATRHTGGVQSSVRISVVCHGNVLRSQVLHRYLERALSRRRFAAEVFSCGTAPADQYPHIDDLLAEVQEQLDVRGVDVRVERTPWSQAAAEVLTKSDVVLVADKERRAEVLARTGLDPARVYLFYEYIGEGSKDFVDTYDPDKGGQDQDRFARSFDELERIAELAAERLVKEATP